MHIGQTVLAKHDNKIQEFMVKDMSQDTLILVKGDIQITRYFWEVAKFTETNNEEKD